MSDNGGLASIIFAPDAFKPDNKPLLTPADWQLIQLSLNDFMNLPLTKDQMPYPSVLKIYQGLHESAVDFHDNTLTKSYNLGGDLYGYGQKAKVYFQAAVRLLDADVPHWDNVRTLLGKLRDSTNTYKSNAKAVYDGAKDYGDHIASQQNPLNDAVTAEKNIITSDQGGVKKLNDEIAADKTGITNAQNAILADQADKKKAVYYAWVWPIGSIVALAKTIADNNDINAQQAKINNYLIDIHEKSVQLATLNRNIAHMTSTVSTNQNLGNDIAKTLPLITKIEDAWHTIYIELDKAVSNINAGKDPDVTIIAANLTTAVNEWHDVANDAHDYLENFHIVGIDQAPPNVKAEAAKGLSSTPTNK